MINVNIEDDHTLSINIEHSDEIDISLNTPTVEADLAAGGQGPRGFKGDTGDTGAKGDTGPQGNKGDTGEPFVYENFTSQQLESLIGPKGDQGLQGLQGIQGIKGDKGDTGLTGAQGIQGPTGLTGPVGITGIQGIQGIKGDTGDTGLTGEKGDQGDPFEYTDFTPEQLSNLTGPQGIKGDKGDTGLKGDTGSTGLKGDTGAKGDTGLTGPQGEQGIQGIQGIQGVAGSITDGTKGDIVVSGSGSAFTVANEAVTNAKLAHMAQNTIKGRITASTGDAEDLTAANVRSIINVADGATANIGGTPAIVLGTANVAGTSADFLRRDDTILAFDATALTAEAIASTSSVGTATTAARRDHRHAMPTALAMLSGIGGGYAACATAIGTAAKVVTLAGYSLVVGGTVGVAFTNGNSAANPTININSKGAKPLYIDDIAVSTITAGFKCLLMYDGTNYNIINSLGKEDTSNKVTSISSSSTDLQYPSAKLFYDQLGTKQAIMTKSVGIDVSTKTDDSKFVTCKSLSDGGNILRSSTSQVAVSDIWVGTQAQYDAIGTKSSTTLYEITG